MSEIRSRDNSVNDIDQRSAISRLLSSLRLTQGRETDYFFAPASGGEGPRAFGGHLIAVAVVAAGQTVERGRVHAVQATFLRPGARSLGTALRVARLFDGRSCHVRGVTLEQEGRALVTAVVSFHDGSGDSPRRGEQPSVPRPQSIGQPVTRFSPWSDQAGVASACPFQLRRPGIDVTSSPADQGGGRADGAGYRSNWLRAAGDAPVGQRDDLLHAALLAYASDITPMESAMVAAGRSPYSDELAWATLSHSLWIHRAPRMDRWTLVEQHCAAFDAGRALVCGRLVDQGGGVVASFSQEGSIGARRALLSPSAAA